MSLVPFDDRDGWIWLDGQFVPWREAKVHVLTHGLHYASAVFEGERMYGGEIYKLTEHTERLFKSAEMLDFDPQLTSITGGRGDFHMLFLIFAHRYDIGTVKQYVRCHQDRIGKETMIGDETFGLFVLE